MEKGFKAMVEREQAAFDRLVESLVELGEVDYPAAVKVAKLYLSKQVRAVRLDVVTGTFAVKHGAFLDKEVIRRAAEQAD